MQQKASEVGLFRFINKQPITQTQQTTKLRSNHSRDSLEVFRFDFCSLMVAMFDSMRLVHSFQSELANELDVVPQGIRTYNLIIFY
jgi:hypothetical protein